MRYTVRYAHLEHLPEHKIGDAVGRGSALGYMGNSGASDGAHLHIDCIEGFRASRWRLSEMENGTVIPAPKQLNYFIDDELFNHRIHITTYYADPAYMAQRKKLHLAYDVVPLNRRESKNNFTIYWNRSFPGVVLSAGDDNAYGNFIHIGFEA